MSKKPIVLNNTISAEEAGIIAITEFWEFMFLELKAIPVERRAHLYKTAKAKVLNRIRQATKESQGKITHIS